MQLAIPEVASLPLNETSNGWLYQPFASGPRAGDTETLGGVASYLNENVFGADTLPALIVHVPETDADLESGP